MASLVTAQLGTKENPHPYISRGAKDRIKGHCYLNKKGIVCIAGKKGYLRPLPEFIKNDTSLKMARANNIIKYSDIVKIFDDCESELLWNEDDYNKQYQCHASNIDYKCSMCNEEKKESLRTIRKKKKENKNGDILCSSCSRKDKHQISSAAKKYSDIVKIFDDCESELLWNEDDYKKNYKNQKSVIDYKCSMCNEEKKESLRTIMRRKKSPITDNNVFCLSCHKKEVGLAGRTTYESICYELKDTEYVLLWDEKIFNKRYKGTRTRMKFKSKKCGHEFNATTIMMKHLYKYKNLSCCPDCNFKNAKKTRYINNNYNSLTNELRCECCKKWKNKTDNFRHYSDGSIIMRCNDCEKEKRQIKYINYTQHDYINNIVKLAKKRHSKRIKNGRIFKSDFNITTKDIYDLINKQKNKCVYTGVNMLWKTNSGDFRGSLDRIDSNETYCKNNIQLVCFWANISKNNSTHGDFIKYCKMVAEHIK